MVHGVNAQATGTVRGGSAGVAGGRMVHGVHDRATGTLQGDRAGIGTSCGLVATRGVYP